MNNIIVISVGDIEGIGIDLLTRLWKLKKIKKFILFTNIIIFKRYIKKRKLNLKINKLNNNLKKNIIFLNNFFNIYYFK